ncbi:MAG: TonB-dependent receptor [Thermodesulfobacteriota bacterium]
MKLTAKILVSAGCLLSLSAKAVPCVAATETEKMQAVEEMFDSPFTEEMYYRADRLLLTATKRQTSLRKAPATATVVTSEEIRNMGARNIRDVLQMVPGLGVSINEQGVHMFEMRGIRTTLSEKILVMIDGHSINRNYVGSALAYVLDDLGVEHIKQVEIIRGPGSALYGANAFVGVINIITKERDDVESLEMAASGGSFDTRKLHLLGGASLEELEILGSVDHWNTNGDNLRIDRDRISGTAASTAPGDAGTANEQTDFFLKAMYKNFSFRGQYLTKHRGTLVGFNYALTDENDWQVDNFWGELGYHAALTDSLLANIKIYFDQFEQDAKLELFPEGYRGLFPDGVLGQPLLKNRTKGSEVQFDYDLSTANHLILGIMYEKNEQFDVRHFTNYDTATGDPALPLQDVSATGNFNRDTGRELWAFYLQDEWAIRDDLDMTIGLRYDHYSDFGDTFNPRIGLVLELFPGADLKLLYGEAFRAPNFVELYNANNPVIVGNPALEPEEIKTYEAGIGVDLGRTLTANVSFFYSTIDKLIAWDTSTAPARYTNRGGAQVDGVELTLDGVYSKNTYWKASYSYQDPKDDSGNARLPDVPSQRATLGVNYSFSQYLAAHVDVLWTGKRPRSTGDTRPDMPSYTTVDLTVTAKNLYDNLELQGSIHNLFDTRYSDPDTSGSQQFLPDDFPRDGISVLGTIRYRY